MNSECFRRRLNKAREQKDLIQKLPYFISWCVKYRPLVYFKLCSFLPRKTPLFLGFSKKKLGGRLLLSLLGHYLSISSDFYQRNLLRRVFSLAVTDYIHFSLHHYSKMASLFFTPAPILHILPQKCLHIQFTDVPCFHALAPEMHVSLISVPKCQLAK